MVLALRLKPGPQTVFGQGGKVSDTGNGLHTVVLRRVFVEDPGVAPQTEHTHGLAVGLRQTGQQRRVAISGGSLFHHGLCKDCPAESRSAGTVRHVGTYITGNVISLDFDTLKETLVHAFDR